MFYDIIIISLSKNYLSNWNSGSTLGKHLFQFSCKNLLMFPSFGTHEISSIFEVAGKYYLILRVSVDFQLCKN